MGAGHDHAIPGTQKEGLLFLALLLTSSYLIVAVIGSYVTGSLALLSEAAHMLTDAAAMAIALTAIRIARRPTDAKRTYGYHRFEILAAAFNAILLFLIAAYIIYEAYRRFFLPAEVQSIGMLIVASFGLIINLISLRLLTLGKDKSLNMKSAYLEVWSDMLGALGVIIAAIIIRITGFSWVDSVIAILIGLWVLPRAWTILRESMNILLEGVPEGVDLEKINQAICDIEGVSGLHDLHIWAITTGKTALTAHIVVDQKYDCETTVQAVRELLDVQFHITHSTLQHERPSDVSGENCLEH